MLTPKQALELLARHDLDLSSIPVLACCGGGPTTLAETQGRTTCRACNAPFRVTTADGVTRQLQNVLRHLRNAHLRTGPATPLGDLYEALSLHDHLEGVGDLSRMAPTALVSWHEDRARWDRHAPAVRRLAAERALPSVRPVLVRESFTELTEALEIARTSLGEDPRWVVFAYCDRPFSRFHDSDELDHESRELRTAVERVFTSAHSGDLGLYCVPAGVFEAVISVGAFEYFTGDDLNLVVVTDTRPDPFVLETLASLLAAEDSLPRMPVDVTPHYQHALALEADRT